MLFDKPLYLSTISIKASHGVRFWIQTIQPRIRFGFEHERRIEASRPPILIRVWRPSPPSGLFCLPSAARCLCGGTIRRHQHLENAEHRVVSVVDHQLHDACVVERSDDGLPLNSHEDLGHFLKPVFLDSLQHDAVDGVRVEARQYEVFHHHCYALLDNLAQLQHLHDEGPIDWAQVSVIFADYDFEFDVDVAKGGRIFKVVELICLWWDLSIA